MISDDGGGEVTKRGLCWSTGTEPTIADNFTIDGAGTGNFESELMDLVQGMEYYVRAYATNSEGTAYGNEISFTTDGLPEKIYEGDLVLKSQAEIDDFGLQGYTAVDGNLTIDDQTTDFITNLTGLENLSWVSGRLTFSTVALITDLQGLNNLHTVEEALIIISNPNLLSLNGLSDLTTLGGLNLQLNPVLNNLESLSGVTELKSEGLLLYYNDALMSLEGLHRITNIVAGPATIISNEALVDLDGLRGLISVDGLFDINNNDSLLSLDGLDSLQSIDNNLFITGNDALVSLSGFGALQDVLGIGIYFNSLLSTIDGFSGLSRIGLLGLNIENNASLINFNGFSNLTAIDGGLLISDNDILEVIQGFDRLNSVGNSLIIRLNTSLISLEGFGNLTSIGDELEVTQNVSLTTLDGLDRLRSAGGISVTRNDSLTDFCSLELAINSGFAGTYFANENAYNPSLLDIEMGFCAP